MTRTGITEALAIAEISGAHHIPVAPHHSVGLGVALATGLHVSIRAAHSACESNVMTSFHCF